MNFGHNQPRSQPIVRVTRLGGSGTRAFAFTQAHLYLRRLSHLTPPLSCGCGRAGCGRGGGKGIGSWGVIRPHPGGKSSAHHTLPDGA
jgi:hypothetical protein